MKSNVRKILSFVMLIAVLALSLSMTAFAAEESGATSGTDASQGQTGGANMWLVIVLYVAFFGVVGYFLIFRPNKKRRKQEEELRSSIILGDEVTTIGGIVGRVVNIKDDNITIETSLDKTLMDRRSRRKKKSPLKLKKRTRRTIRKTKKIRNNTESQYMQPSAAPGIVPRSGVGGLFGFYKKRNDSEEMDGIWKQIRKTYGKT